MRARTRRSLPIAAALVLLVVLAGCTGGGGPYEDVGSTTVEEPSWLEEAESAAN